MSFENQQVRKWRLRPWWFLLGGLGLLGIGLASMGILAYKRIPEITTPMRSPQNNYGKFLMWHMVKDWQNIQLNMLSGC